MPKSLETQFLGIVDFVNENEGGIVKNFYDLEDSKRQDVENAVAEINSEFTIANRHSKIKWLFMIYDGHG
jgi:hypothetical protein